MMSAATAPAKRTAENVTATDESSQVQLIHMGGELDVYTADGLTERSYAAIGRDPRVLLAGAPFSLLAAANRGRQAADNAWRVLADPTARQMHDVDIGSGRPGGGL
jgi:hypothetical protein